MAVCSLLLFSFMAYADTLRTSSETRQLKNLMDSVAAKSTELLTLTLATNATSETFLSAPVSIGNKQYWLQFHNDSGKVWLDGGLGDVPIKGIWLRLFLPKEASARGCYIAGYGAIHLKCYLNMSVPQILFINSGDGD